jgi:hypothetical protein
MNVIPPLAITDALLTASSVVETAPSAYAGGTTYALNDTASVAGAAGLITVYQSLQAGNIGHTPASSPTWWMNLGNVYQVYSGGATYALGDRVEDTTAHLVYESLLAGNIGNALSNTAKWLLIGPTNRWAMFDLLRSTASIVPGSLTVVITPGVVVNALSLLGLAGDSVTISMTSGGPTVYTHTQNLDTREVFDWYDYFFDPFSTQDSLALFDLPFHADGIITITLTATAGNVACGGCVIGTFVFIGETEFAAVSDVLNFSTVTRDFAGGTNTLVQRRNVPKTQQQLVLDKALVNTVRALRDSLNAIPAVWSGLDDSSDGYFEALLILGFYKQFSIDLALPTQAIITLELEEI